MSIRFDSLNNSDFLNTPSDNSNDQLGLTRSNTTNNNIDSKAITDNELSSSQKNESQESKLGFINDRNGFSDFRALQINNKLANNSNLLASNLQASKQATTQPNTSSKYSNLESSVKEKNTNVSSTSKSNPQTVKELQSLINTHTGDKLEVNGNFDSKTQAAVRTFQRASDLPVTGAVDNKTLQALENNKTKISDYYLHARYTPDDLTKLYDKGDPKSVYTPKDDLVNYIAEGEGKFNEAEDLGDGGGLSVGIIQWTQNSGRLGELTAKYKEVATQAADKRATQQVKEEIINKKLRPELAEQRKAELSDQYNEFYSSFGGKKAANELLHTLQTNPKSISSSSIAKEFRQAGDKPVFQRAQRELALSAVSDKYLPKIIPSSPYAKNGTLSKQTIAISLAISNVGESALSKLNNRVVKEKYAELVDKNPKIEEDINKKLNGLGLSQIRENFSKEVTNPSVRNEVEKELTNFQHNYDKTHSTKNFSPEKLEAAKQQRQAAIEQKEAQIKLPLIKEELKRNAVAQNVSEEEYNNRLIELAPSTLYSPANERKFGKGLNNRLTRLADSASSQEQVNLR